MGGCGCTVGSSEWWRSMDGAARGGMTRDQAKMRLLGDPILMKTHKSANLNSDASWQNCGWGVMNEVFKDPAAIARIEAMGALQVKQMENSLGKRPDAIDWAAIANEAPEGAMKQKNSTPMNPIPTSSSLRASANPRSRI